jgi:lipoyl(octanoyl) transferase
MRSCEVRELGRIGFTEAYRLQQALVARRKQGLIPDQLLLVEHPHVVTLGRNAQQKNLLASEEILSRSGIALEVTDRGGDVTYHGPGQIIAYPIFDLREWKRDVVAYVRALEQVIIDALAGFGIGAGRMDGCTGVWVEEAKVAAIGVHLSRWVTSHGFALNVDTDLDYFRYIVPCGLTRPVTSLRQLGCAASGEAVTAALLERFARVFQLELVRETRTPERIA